MEWTDDPLVWDGLDDLLQNVWPDLKQFLDALHEHSDEINPHWRGLLFGGLGQLVAAYVTARSESNDPKQAYAVALEVMVANPAFAGMMQGMVNQTIDGAVVKMEDSA
jgi:hypothetical protein